MENSLVINVQLQVLSFTEVTPANESSAELLHHHLFHNQLKV